MSGGSEFDPILHFGDFLGPLLTIIFFGWLLVQGFRSIRRKPAREPVKDRPEQPYTVFTRAFDVVQRGRDLGLSLPIDEANPAPSGISVPLWADRIALGEEAWMASRTRFGEKPFCIAAGDVVVTVLVDQSGSTRDMMPALAGVLRHAVEAMDAVGLHVSLLGFTSVGWRGGPAYKAWLGGARRPYPGRLCALRHIVYKDFAETALDPEDWKGLLHPRVLCENVDGEAVEWAAGLLRARSEARKLLVLISDGVPMDDATVLHNGLGFLARHFKSVVNALRDEGLVHFEVIEVAMVNSKGERLAGVVEPEEVAAALTKLVNQFICNHGVDSSATTSSVS